jgi:uncharacterized protein (DUF4415 family)
MGMAKHGVSLALAANFEWDDATGRGWQTRLNDAMREWLKVHTAGSLR